MSQSGLEEFEIKGEELFSKDGVLLQTAKDECLHSGRLSVTKTKHGVFVKWEKTDVQQNIFIRQNSVASKNEEKTPPNSFIVGSPADSAGWAVIAGDAEATPKDQVKFRSNSIDSPSVKFSSELTDKRLTLVAELVDIRSYRLGDDGNTVTLLMKDGTTHNTLIFLDEGPEEFLATFKTEMSVRQSMTDDFLYLLTDKKTAALDQSLSELNLFDRPNGETVWRALGELQKDPYTAGLTILSKVADRYLFSPLEERYRPEDEMAELLRGETVSNSLDCHNEEVGSENWQVVNSRGTLLKNLEASERGEPLCQLDWELHFGQDGVAEDVPGLLEKIFRGGVDESIRDEVWKFLLGFYQWHHTTEVRATNRQARVDEYFRMKLQWKSMSEDQQNRFSGFRERKSQIEKDIGRTDRTHPYYQGDKNTNVELLQDILMTYVMYNFDLGYVQGMSDLLSPLLFTMKNEVDAFWCFVGFMDRVASNFDLDQGGMKHQLDQLTTLLKYLDVSLYNYLESKDSGNMFFCFRWLLIWFKREFNYSDTMRLWEVLWTKKPCKNFHLVFCVALLDAEKTTIMENKYGFTEILKHVNDMSHRINLDQVLCRSEGVYKLIKSDSSVPDQVLNILGIEPDNSSCDQTKAKLKTASLPVPILNGNGDRERRLTESSQTSSSIAHSSSVEVLSEMEEHKFEESLTSNYF